MSQTDDALRAAAGRYFDARRALVPEFCARTFGLRGTLRLHAHAIGWDILRAPVNMVLALVQLTARLTGLILRLCGAKRAGAWLGSRQLLLRTAVAAEVERVITVDLLELPMVAGPMAERPDPSARDALAETLRADPVLHEALRAEGVAEAARAMDGPRLGRTLGEYSGTRAAVAEMTTALGTLGAGAALFKTVTPGVLSIAPAVAALLAQNAAVSGFPLGQTLGGLWYGWFPGDVPWWLTAGSAVGLMLNAALFTAFAGIIADPLQTAFGLHQRRLLRLIDALEDEFTGSDARAFAAREHYLARVLDLADAGVSAIKVLRG